MNKGQMLNLISKVVKKNIHELSLWVMLNFIEKKIFKSEKEHLYYIDDTEVWKSVYYLLMFDDLREDKDKWLMFQKKDCIKYFYNLCKLLKKINVWKE